MMSHLLVALVLLDMLEHGDESLLERRLPKLMVFYNGLLDYWRIPYVSTLARRRSSWKMRDVQRSFSARPSMAEICHL